MHVITCASSLPTESWRTLRVVLSTLGGMGSVLATTTSSSAHASMRSAACPLKRPCVAKAKTLRAPKEMSSLAAAQSVPGLGWG